MTASRLARSVWAAWVVASAVATTSTVVEASPGTCKCNSGCHANPGQCVQGNGCSIGYAPSCGYRTAATGATCPKTEYISCNGDCTCAPIPNFCETVGGAEYCDAGPPDAAPDTFVPDTYVPDTYVPDTYVEDTYVEDTYVEEDTYVYVPPPDTYVPPPPDTYVPPPPDTYVPPPPDTYVPPPPDTYVPPPDTFVPDTYVPPPDTFVPDTCVPLECPSGTRAIPIAGQCDPFCAQPCGGGEFKCAWLAGATCVDGVCVPNCLITGCPDCARCSLGDGKCFSESSACVDAGADTAISADDAPTPGSGTTPSTNDAGSDATVGKTPQPTVFAEADEAETADVGGCGCRVATTTSSRERAGIVTFLATLSALFVARRRCVHRATSRTRSP